MLFVGPQSWCSSSWSYWMTFPQACQSANIATVQLLPFLNPNCASFRWVSITCLVPLSKIFTYIFPHTEQWNPSVWSASSFVSFILPDGYNYTSLLVFWDLPFRPRFIEILSSRFIPIYPQACMASAVSPKWVNNQLYFSFGIKGLLKFYRTDRCSC